jgi:hypothetical protein
MFKVVLSMLPKIEKNLLFNLFMAAIRLSTFSVWECIYFSISYLICCGYLKKVNDDHALNLSEV